MIAYAAIAAALLAAQPTGQAPVTAPTAPSMPTTIITAPGPAGPLEGAMTGPARADAPMILIVPGSGPTDRDGNNSLGMRPASYRLLAEALADHGIATVRIDKRGMFGSARAVADPNAVRIADYAADVATWAATLTRTTGRSCVWIAGHSEGGLVALRAAGAPGVCGIILIATPGRPVGATLRAQMRANPVNAPLLADAERALDSLERSERVEVSGMHPALQSMFAPAVQGFMIDLFAQDPVALARAAKGPLMVIGGDADLQVPVEDSRMLAAAREDATTVIVPGMTHVLKRPADAGQAANVATYTDPSLPLHDEVAPAIAAFVKARRP